MGVGDLGKSWTDSNKTWRLVNCIQNVKYGTVVTEKSAEEFPNHSEGSDWVECTAYGLLTLSAFINCILCVFLVYFHSQQKGLYSRKFKHIKTWILVLFVVMNLAYLIKLLLIPKFPVDNILRKYKCLNPPNFSFVIEVIFYLLKYTVTILLCYYFIRRCGLLVSKCDRERFKRRFQLIVIIYIIQQI